MQVKEIKQEGLNHELEVTVTAKDIDSRVDSRLVELGQTMSLPGFRPGKVPMKILKKRYGKSVMGEVLELAVNETSAKVMKDKEIRPALQPKIEVKSFDDGKDLVYSIAVESLPTFEVMDFKKLKLEKPVAKPDDKAVEDALARLAEGAQSTEEVKTKRAAKEGDTLVISFDGRTADDDKRHDGMQSDEHQLKLGSGTFIPGFEDQLIGKKAGDKVEVKVSFPENYGAQELAGRDAIFDVEIKALREPAEAKIDDEFAKNFGMDDLDALKTAIEEQLSKEFDMQSRLVVKKLLLDALDDAHDFEIPAGMLDMEYTNIIQQLELERQRNPQEDQAAEITDEEKAEYKEISERRVRLGLILSDVGQSNNIQITDAELQRSVITEAQKFPGQERDVFDYYSKNPKALESLRAPLFEEKVVDFIIELATITEKDVSTDDLMKALEEDLQSENAPKKKKAPAKKADSKEKAPKKVAAKKDDAKKPAAKKAPAKKVAVKKAS